MPFLNRIRLPLYAKQAQFPTEANRFRLADGTTKTLSVSIRKNYQVETDYMTEAQHQRLVVALNHDTVRIEGTRYIGGVTVDGEYQIDWQDFLDYPVAKATVQINVTPFDFTNSNCQTCDQATQLSLVDDDAGELEEGVPKDTNVYTNDSICCYPVTASITWFDTGYLASATIDAATGIATLTTKDPVATVGSIKLATYRVTCPDGSYDEADIYGSIVGSGDACEQPSEFLEPDYSDDPPLTVTIEFAAPVVDPSGGYEWQLFEADDLGTPIQTGTEADKTVLLENLEYGKAYVFYIRSICDDGIVSPYSQQEFTTPSSDFPDCGRFEIAADDGTLGSGSHAYSYMDCAGTIQSGGIINLTTKTECMMTDDFGNPVYFQASTSSAGALTVTYQEPC